MGNGYTRQSIFTSGDVIKAEHGNDEFNQVVAAMAQATGHTHGGGAAEGAYVPLISDPTNTDKVEVVTGGAKTTGTHQITGAATLDSTLAVAGTTTTANISTTGNITITGTVDGRDLSVDGAKLDTITGATATTITDASLLPFTPAGNIVATDAQAAIEEVATDADAKIDPHLADTANPHTVTIDQITPTTTKGDIIVEDGTNAIRLAIGSNVQVLTADSAEASGIKWADAPKGLVFLSSVTASTSATVDLETTFDSTFDAYVIEATNITMSVDGGLLDCRLKVGGSYDTGSNYKYHRAAPASDGAAYSADFSASDTIIRVSTNIGFAADESFSFSMNIKDPASTVFQKMINWSGSSINQSGVLASITGAGLNTSTAALTGVRFLPLSGTIDSGTFRLYGITNS